MWGRDEDRRIRCPLGDIMNRRVTRATRCSMLTEGCESAGCVRNTAKVVGPYLGEG